MLFKATIDPEACWCENLLEKMRSLALAPRRSMACNAAELVVFLLLTSVFVYGAADGLVSGEQLCSSKQHPMLLLTAMCGVSRDCCLGSMYT
jgi:hypothetical protein